MSKNIVSNRTMIDNDTFEIVDKYIDQICENPDFLCENMELCGNNTSIYANVKNVETICNDMKQANICDIDIKECIVLANNSFDESQKFVSTSFINIIIPIPKAIDENGNQKFIRLPSLSGSKKPDSLEICNVCACMDRFARSPGSGFNDYTSPGQNECVYSDDFEYYYYPLQIEKIRDSNKLIDPPPVIVGSKKYNVVNKNIITIKTEDDLSIINLYNILTNAGISDFLTKNFILNVLYKGNKQSAKELNIYLSKNNSKTSKFGKSSFGNSTPSSSNKDIVFTSIIIIIFFLIVLINLKN